VLKDAQRGMACEMVGQLLLAGATSMSGRTGNPWILGRVREGAPVHIQIRSWFDGGGTRSRSLIDVVLHHVEEIIDLIRRVPGWLNVRVGLGGHDVSLK